MYETAAQSEPGVIGGSVRCVSETGIDGDCGGECACATCHVHVDAAWMARTGMAEPGGMEANLLQFAEGSTENSRLACQITMTDDLDGLMLRIPDGQH